MRAYIGYYGVSVPRRILVCSSYRQCRRMTTGGVIEVVLDDRYAPMIRNGAIQCEFEQGYVILAKRLKDGGVLPPSVH